MSLLIEGQRILGRWGVIDVQVHQCVSFEVSKKDAPGQGAS